MTDGVAAVPGFLVHIALSRALNRTCLEQAEIAERMRVSPSRLSEWANGRKTPSVARVAELCGVLGVSVDEFYAGLVPAQEAA